jgi:predicted ATP-dependent endonuclease of OLD family
MQKIIIKNFGAIAYAEIEIKKVLVLIGEQASGKSTIAKLIYFFKSLKDDVFKKIYLDKKITNFSEADDIHSPLRSKFYNFFGQIYRYSEFEITYYYDFEEHKYLKISVDIDPIQNQKIKIEFSENFFSNEFKSYINRIKGPLHDDLKRFGNEFDISLIHDLDKVSSIKSLRLQLTKLFNSYQSNLLFIIAGRNVTVSYSELFEKYLFAEVQNRAEKTIGEGFELKSLTVQNSTVDESLMLEFIEKISRVKNIFREFKSFENLIHASLSLKYEEDTSTHNKVKKKLDFIKDKSYKILKGEYLSDGLGEKIKISSRMAIDISDTSSGQQEVIRILQDIFICILENSTVLRIVEEPEAHLFPIAQKDLIELLALMVNQNNDNQLIITTHSPYVLTVFNNLLFAQRVVDKNPSAEAEVAELIPKEFWLKAKDFSAYSLGNASIHEEPEYCESIFNNQTGAIQQNYLDAVSEMLGGDFNYLYSLYAKTVRRK